MNLQRKRSLCIWFRGTRLGVAAILAFANLSPGQNSPDASPAVFKPVPDKEGEALPFDANISGEAQPPASPMAWWYLSPATKFWEGLPLGTGRFAAMVF